MDNKKILEAIDLVCLNCVEDTLTDNSCCENCPVRKTYNSLTKEKEQLNINHRKVHRMFTTWWTFLWYDR